MVFFAMSISMFFTNVVAAITGLFLTVWVFICAYLVYLVNLYKPFYNKFFDDIWDAIEEDKPVKEVIDDNQALIDLMYNQNPVHPEDMVIETKK